LKNEGSLGEGGVVAFCILRFINELWREKRKHFFDDGISVAQSAAFCNIHIFHIRVSPFRTKGFILVVKAIEIESLKTAPANRKCILAFVDQNEF